MSWIVKDKEYFKRLVLNVAKQLEIKPDPNNEDFQMLLELAKHSYSDSNFLIKSKQLFNLKQTNNKVVKPQIQKIETEIIGDEEINIRSKLFEDTLNDISKDSQ